jgi:RNA-directed DNA polymerase
LHLTVNETKSAVASVFGRKFLGLQLWVAKGRGQTAWWPRKPGNLQAAVRQLTRRSGGRSMARKWWKRSAPYMLGWKAYFGLAQTPSVWRELDEWLRHRLRAIQLKHWKRPRRCTGNCKALGARRKRGRRSGGQQPALVAQQRQAAQHVLTIAYFDRLGLPRLS